MSRLKAPRGDPRRLRLACGGFTLVEILVVLAVSSLLGGLLFTLMVSQHRGYTKVRERGDVHGTLRSAAAMLMWDLRSASAADIRSIGPSGLVIRSFPGTGVLCSVEGSGRFGLVSVEGDFSAASDSVLVFMAGSSGTADDSWRALDLQSFSTAPGTTCAWASMPPVEQEMTVGVAVPADTTGIRVGASVRTFRWFEYGTHQWNGRWWLGRRIPGTGAWEPLAGPLPDSDGVRFLYYDASGSVTTTPAAVASVELVVRAESAKRASPSGGFETDSLSVRVSLRG